MFVFVGRLPYRPKGPDADQAVRCRGPDFTGGRVLSTIGGLRCGRRAHRPRQRGQNTARSKRTVTIGSQARDTEDVHTRTQHACEMNGPR